MNNEKGEKVKKLQWVSQLCFLCSQLYNRFNMGNYYEKLVAASEDIGIDFFALVNFSDTRFANSKRFVFLNVLRMLPALIRVLETDIARAEANKHQLEASDPYIQQKGAESRELRGKFFNQEILLLLAGVSDIYMLYGTLVCVSQEFRLFPHMRLDKFNSVLDTWEEMTEHFEHMECDGRDCTLSNFHQAVTSLKVNSTIKGVLVPDRVPVNAAGLNARTRNNARLEVDENDGLIADKVKGKLKHLSWSLCTDLRWRVIKDEEVRVIEYTRHILDYDKMMKEMKEKVIYLLLYLFLVSSRLPRRYVFPH